MPTMRRRRRTGVNVAVSGASSPLARRRRFGAMAAGDGCDGHSATRPLNLALAHDRIARIRRNAPRGRMARSGDRNPHAKQSQAELPRSLAGVDLIACLDEPSRQALERRCLWRRWAPGEQIIDRETQTSDVYFVVAGLARVIDYDDSGRREVIFDEIGPGGYFGELAAIDGEPRSAHIVAAEETVTALLPGEAFIEMLFQHREAGLALMRRMSEMIRQSTTRIMDLSTLGAHN